MRQTRNRSWRRCWLASVGLALVAGGSILVNAAKGPAEVAQQHGRQFEQAVAASQRGLHAWLKAADPRTLLLPDRLDDPAVRVYTPHNSGADLYPYLILTAHLTDPDLYRERLMDMLRNEVRYTT